MNPHCFEFRIRLTDALFQGGSDQASPSSSVGALGWHEHLLACEDCRQLLEGEQALDDLLGSLPMPRLHEDRRLELLQRLSLDLRLETLLEEADLAVNIPHGLVERVRRSVLQELHDQRIDTQLAKLDRIVAPKGLSQRVLQHCRDQAEVQTPEPSVVSKANSPGHSAPARVGKARPVWMRHWIPTGLVAAGLAALLWYLPGIGGSNPGNADPSDNNSAKGIKEPNGNEMDTPAPLDSEANDDFLAVLDSLEVLDLVDELEDEEWELLDEYDELALFLMDDENGSEAR